MKFFLHSLLIFYSPRYPNILVYMLQSTEYKPWPYLRWYWRTQNFADVMKRRQLDFTLPARLLLLALRVSIVLQISVGIWLIYLWQSQELTAGLEFGLAVIVAYPVVWAHVVVLPLLLGRFLIVVREKRLIRESEVIFKKHKGVKIAIAGSYGKTSMKELLVTILGQGKRVASTPANMNVPISHARFARTLRGEEDVVVIEYGEGAPGDVERFAHTTHPTHGIITGLAPVHLDQYKTLEAAGKDIFSLARYLKHQQVYVNKESEATQPFIKPEHHTYDRMGTLNWKVNKVKVGLDGTRFTLTKGKRTLKLHSQLLGRHHLGPLSLAVALAIEFGLSDEEITKGVAETKPFDHRMQPYLLNGAWVIDDAYNGNIEGIRAGTELLKELPGKRKIYVTPGLVDQGTDSSKIHEHMGELIAVAQPDLVVLMKNSTTEAIQKGLDANGFKGELQIEPNPLEFYTNLGQFIAVGDIVMLQNDWPDNYA